MGKSKLTAEQIAEIKVLYKQGKSSPELGRIYQVDHTTILYWLHRRNTEMRPKGNLKGIKLKKSQKIVTGSYYKDIVKKQNKFSGNEKISVLFVHKMRKIVKNDLNGL